MLGYYLVEKTTYFAPQSSQIVRLDVQFEEEFPFC